MVTDDLWFVGVACDGGRVGPADDDIARLAGVLEGRGFTLEDTEPVGDGKERVIRLRSGSFYARVVVAADWMVSVITDSRTLHVSRDADVGQRGLDRFIDLVATVTDFADAYYGAVSNDPDDNLLFFVEDPPVELHEPLALVYVGRRYLVDWGVPGFAADAEIDIASPAGRLIVPVVDELA